jgi:hypothetical protein
LSKQTKSALKTRTIDASVEMVGEKGSQGFDVVLNDKVIYSRLKEGEKKPKVRATRLRVSSREQPAVYIPEEGPIRGRQSLSGETIAFLVERELKAQKEAVEKAEQEKAKEEKVEEPSSSRD